MKMKRTLTLLISMVMLLSAVATTGFAEKTYPAKIYQLGIDSNTVWKYLDDNTDPAGDSSSTGYERTSWAAPDFDDSRWKTAKGPFGAKKGGADLGYGYVANTVLAGCEGTNCIPTYFFRTEFEVPTFSGMTKLVGDIQYDDGAIIYINGKRAAALDDTAVAPDKTALCHPIDSNTVHGGSNYRYFTQITFEVYDLSMLKQGKNTIAVELHNGNATSDNIWFNMTNLRLVDEPIEHVTNICISMGADESKANFTWYSTAKDANALSFVKKSELIDDAMPQNVQKIPATTIMSNDTNYYSNKATVTGLEPNTEYVYMMSGNGFQSKKYTFKTGAKGDFSFACLADPQIGASFGDANSGVFNKDTDTEEWNRTLYRIDNEKQFSDISFMLSLGDQVNKAWNEDEYDRFLDNDFFKKYRVATVIGNHDTNSNAYSQHFNIANESSQYGVTAAGGNSYFIYNDVLFIVLNNTAEIESADDHKAFMEQVMEETKVINFKWKIVAMHESVYTISYHANDSHIIAPEGFRNNIVPIFEEMGIDVVLQGHDHVYCRTYIMDGLEPITESDKYIYGNGREKAPTAVYNPDGILYLTFNSATKAKTYDVKNQDFPFAAVKNQEHIPNISKIEISDGKFSVVTYRTTDMTVVDEFTIYQDSAAKAFKDIDENDWFYNDVDLMVKNGIISGVSGDRFEPYTPATRGMTAAVLYRMAGSLPQTGNLDFIDIPIDSYLKEAAKWAVYEGIMSETDNLKFAPEQNITYKQFANALYNYAASKNNPETDAIKWCEDNGIDCGVDEDAEISRAQMVSMISKLKKIVDTAQ